jgi:hypothetical protein
MMRGLFGFLMLFFTWSVATAEVPHQLHYQGYLTNAVGDPVDCPDPIQCADSINLTFKLYDDALANASLWQETHLALAIYQGNFHVTLGSETILDPEDIASSRWLGISVNGGAEMAPRQKLSSAPFAMHAENAGQADVAINATQLGGIDAAEFVLPEDLQDGDADSLGALSCAVDAVPKWNGSAWYCGVDGGGDDTTLSESEVDSMVANNGYSMGDHTVDTTLSEEQVDAMVGNNGYAAQTATISALSCAEGEVAQWNGAAWVCASGGGKISVGEGPICNTTNAGSMYLDAAAGVVWVCDGSLYNKIKYCGGVCPSPDTLPCGSPIVDDCGDSCTATGTALNLAACPDPAIIACGLVVEDGCGNSCGVTGLAPNPALCADPAEVACDTAITDTCSNDCGGPGTGINLDQCDVAGLPCGQAAFDNCDNDCGISGTELNLAACADPGLHPCGTALNDPCDNACPSGNVCNIGVCISGECSNLNWPGSILEGSAFSGPPVPGYSQCAGFRNTGSWDIVTTDWIHSCAGDGSKKWMVRVYNVDTNAVLYEDTFPSFTSSELQNNLPGCGDSGYGPCGKLSTAGTGHALLVYKPNNGNGGCHGDDNSSGAFRICPNTEGSTMGQNYLFVGGKRFTGSTRSHDYGDQPNSEIRFPGGGGTWNGCGEDARVTHAVTVYLED